MPRTLIIKLICLLFILSNCTEPEKPKKTNNKLKDSVLKTEKSKTATPFIVEENGFSITFPDAPQKTLDTIGQAEYTLSENDDSVRYMIYYKDYTSLEVKNIGGKEKLMEIQLNQIIETHAFKPADILENKTISLQKNTARTFKAGNSEKFFLIYKSVFVENRLYQFLISSKKEYPTPQTTQRFIESFTLKENKEGISTI